MSENALTSGDFTEQNEPYALFGTWLEEAGKTEPNDPNAVALATVDEAGLPNVRMVLLKGFDTRGFVFYTNFESRKGEEILGARKAAMCFHWKSLRRQVRIRGEVEIVSLNRTRPSASITPPAILVPPTSRPSAQRLEAVVSLGSFIGRVAARQARGGVVVQKYEGARV